MEYKAAIEEAEANRLETNAMELFSNHSADYPGWEALESDVDESKIETANNLMEQANEIRLEAHSQVQVMFNDDCCSTRLSFDMLKQPVLPAFNKALSDKIIKYAFPFKQRMDVYSKLELKSRAHQVAYRRRYLMQDNGLD